MIHEQSSTDHIVIQPLDAALGAEVRCGDVSRLGPDGRARLHQAYLDHLVLVFHGQNLSDEALVATSHIFGTPSNTTYGGGESIAVAEITNLGANPFLGAGELSWHSDHSFSEEPLSASLLQALEVPPTGGDTYWNNMYLAYEALPLALQERVRGVTIRQDTTSNSAGQRVAAALDADCGTSNGPSHPIIRTHPDTGQNALYLGRRDGARVNGLSVAESESLLDMLWAHATNPRFEYRHRWTAGDLIVWDNRAVMHRRDAFDETQRRIMHRTQCGGSRTFYDAASASHGLHPRGQSWLTPA